MKKILPPLFTVFVLLNLTGPLLTQNRKIDSLQTVLKTTNRDTTKAKIYVALTEELYLSDIDTVLPLCDKAIQIVDAKLPYATDAEKKSLQTTKANALNNIGYVYKQQGNTIKALEWYNKSLTIREEIGDKHGIAASLNNIGLIYNNQGDIPKALEYYNKGLEIQEEIKDKKGIAISLNNIGFVYYNQDNIPKALEWYHKSLKIREEIKDKEGIATSLNNIGLVYIKQGDFAKALEYYHKSLQIREEIADKKSIAVSLNNLGTIYRDQKDFSKALEWYYKSLKISEEIGEKAGIARTYNNIGQIHTKHAESLQNPDSVSDQLNKALKWVQKSLVIWKETGDKQGMAVSLYNIGSIYLKQANAQSEKNKTDQLLKKAEEYCKLSLKSFNELNYPSNIRDASERLCKIYRSMGELAFNSGDNVTSAKRYKDALEMQDLFKLTADKINNVETQKSILKKQMQFEFEKKENEAKADQEKKDSIAQAEKQRQKLLLWSVACGLLLVLVFSFFMVNRWRIMQKQKSIIEKQNEKIIDSITYAQRIQQSILTEESDIRKYLPDFFIYYQPKALAF